MEEKEVVYYTYAELRQYSPQDMYEDFMGKLIERRRTVSAEARAGTRWATKSPWPETKGDMEIDQRTEDDGFREVSRKRGCKSTATATEASYIRNCKQVRNPGL